MAVLRRLLLAFLAIFAAWPAAADCPITPGRWQGTMTVNLLAMRVDRLAHAVSANVGFSLDFEVACDGTIKGAIKSQDTNEFRLIAAEPAPRQDRCKIAMEMELKSGRVSKGAAGLPVFHVEVLKRTDATGCGAETLRLMPSWLTGAGLGNYEFAAIGYDAKDGLMAGDRAWNVRSDVVGYFTPNNLGARYESGGHVRWVLVRQRP